MSGEAELFPTTGAPAQAGGAYQVLARRARPQTFADVVGQEHVTQTLVNAIRAGRVAHAFVFSGMRGVGKTTTARILAKALNCENGPTAEPCNRCINCMEITEGRSLDVFEVDAASQTGIDAARELLETVKYQPASGRHRIYIIDEAHGLSKQAVDAFLKTLEEPPPHVKFILATTAAHKLPATVLSRCQRYDFRAVAGETVAAALGAIATREGVEADPEALLAIARESGGSMRDATSLLDQVLAFAGGRIDAAAIAESLGLPDRRAVRELLAAVAARSASDALEVLARVQAQGTDLSRLCADLLERIRNLTRSRSWRRRERGSTRPISSAGSGSCSIRSATSHAPPTRDSSSRWRWSAWRCSRHWSGSANWSCGSKRSRAGARVGVHRRRPRARRPAADGARRRRCPRRPRRRCAPRRQRGRAPVAP